MPDCGLQQSAFAMRTATIAVWLTCALAGFGSAVSSSSAQDATPSAAGLWQQIDDRTGESQGWFLISERNGVFEGKIAKMFMRPDDPPNPVCDRCEGDQRGAPWLGLTIITN